jgi:hypothetical protein
MSKPLQSVAGQKVFIDPVVLQEVDATKPSAMSRTSWVNLRDAPLAALQPACTL